MFGLTSATDWNQRHNPKLAADADCGATHWFTVGALLVSLLIGTTILMATLAFSFQRYFEYQAEDSLTAAAAAPRKSAG